MATRVPLRPCWHGSAGLLPRSPPRSTPSSTAIAGRRRRCSGEPQQALEHDRRGLEAAEQVGFRPEVALIRLGLAELLLDHHLEQREQALEYLDCAIAEFQAMQMQPSLERALSRREILKA